MNEKQPIIDVGPQQAPQSGERNASMQPVTSYEQNALREEYLVIPDPGRSRAPKSEERPVYEFHGAELMEDGSYVPPTPEKRELFRSRMERVSEVFEGADFAWNLDGATNISLYRGEMIRDHKDIDLGVYADDIARVLEHLEQQNLGLFLNEKIEGREVLRRVTESELDELVGADVSIGKFDKGGNFDRSSDDPIQLADLHVARRSRDGGVETPYGGTLPVELSEPTAVSLANGGTLNCAHPATVVFHKIHSNRPHDMHDALLLRAHLKAADFATLRQALNQEATAHEERVREYLTELWHIVSPLLEHNSAGGDMAAALWKYPKLKERENDVRARDYVDAITNEVSNQGHMTESDFIERSMQLLRIREEPQKRLERLAQLEELTDVVD